MKYVIIGNSTAAVAAIEAIRKLDQKGSITLIASETHHTYSRPLISYLLCGKTTEQKMKYRPDDFYEVHKVSTMLGKTVVKIEKENVVLDDGKKVPFDKLLIATGSRPFVPPMEGLNSVKNRFTFMSLDDAHALNAAITPESRVLIVGAGLIGLKCAEGIYGSVKEITIVDLAPRVLPSILDEDGAHFVQNFLEEKGVKFILADSVAKFEENKAYLKGGSTVDFDIAVLAVGVRPNTQLAADAGAEVNRGVVVNERLQTSLPNVYAAGDCSEGYDLSIDGKRILALLPNAYMQGECAGTNMAGGDCVFETGIPLNAMGVLGMHMVTAGSYDGEAVVIPVEEGYKKLFTKDNLLKGFIIIGDVQRAGIYTSLIRDQVPLSCIDFDLISKSPVLMAFSCTDRAKKLGGAK